MRTSRWVVGLLLVSSLAGCAGDDGLFAIQIPVFIKSNGDLDPNFANAPTGSKVIVVNHDDVGHTVSFGSPVNSSSFLNPNGSVSVRMPDQPCLVSVGVSEGGHGSISVF